MQQRLSRCPSALNGFWILDKFTSLLLFESRRGNFGVPLVFGGAKKGSVVTRFNSKVQILHLILTTNTLALLARFATCAHFNLKTKPSPMLRHNSHRLSGIDLSVGGRWNRDYTVQRRNIQFTYHGARTVGSA